ncbi:hypothetical protein EPUS_07721 [Endocarpon pusillum Z07020]|uniref:Uncharacterized protein n=1 Tax=Endocarpon pusillum (strain Z07020 / HMAS-L-300199) TaxID=1263415 RepID=U1GNK5_ENDPU|nr:uncharacterized protein EPUS_07721 [Endocarpon pusillum Z07020]ERF73516.1 hypothetical protein EPUS_07721 [Endocarpon pusillum Z07020]
MSPPTPKIPVPIPIPIPTKTNHAARNVTTNFSPAPLTMLPPSPLATPPSRRASPTPVELIQSLPWSRTASAAKVISAHYFFPSVSAPPPRLVISYAEKDRSVPPQKKTKTNERLKNSHCTARRLHRSPARSACLRSHSRHDLKVRGEGDLGETEQAGAGVVEVGDEGGGEFGAGAGVDAGAEA